MTRRPRQAFTLTELLVVMTIMASLMGLVVASSRPSRGTSDDIRRGAQQLASILLASQSLSLGSPTGAAVIIDSSGSCGRAISHARRYPFIEGRVTSGMPPLDPRATQAIVGLTIANDSTDSLVHGYRIRFLDRGADTQGPASDWFSFACAGPPTASVRYRTEEGQSPQTTLWPTLPVSGSLSFEVARYPIPTGIAEVLPKGVAIDMRFSGYGDPSVTEWASLANRGAIGIGFDAVGSMDTLMQNVLPSTGSSRTIQPFAPAEYVYLFVTSLSDIEDSTVNGLASTKAMWVVIHPRTGRVTISANVPQVSTASVTDPEIWRTTDPQGWQNAIKAARANARQGNTVGG